MHSIPVGFLLYFTSWSCATHQMYEAPEPWGPWKIFLSKDFGPLFTPHNYGMYGTSIPSKFISADGKTLYLQSNIWWVIAESPYGAPTHLRCARSIWSRFSRLLQTMDRRERIWRWSPVRAPSARARILARFAD